MTKKSLVKRAYTAPVSDVSETIGNVMICQSGITEDWVYDDDESLTF